MTTPTPRMERLNEAGEWLLRLNDEARTERDVGEWLVWCDASPENLEAFELMQRDWHDLDALKSRKPTASSAPSAVRWRLAAGVAILALTSASAIHHWSTARAPVQQVVAANVNKTATLPDGSLVVLSAQTQVDVDFTGSGRELRLSQGEAYFKVHRDKQRPFVVHAGEVSVMAVGTSFNVRRSEDLIVVTVEEGIVQVAEGIENTWRAEAGYQLTYSTAHRTASLASINPTTALKWRNGELSYVWEPLGVVVADINRYSLHRIVLADPALADLRFTGTVFTSSLTDWLKAVQDAYPVEADLSGNGDIVLRADRSK